jgi:ribosomal-protein-alanine N-acetyltransferase
MIAGPSLAASIERMTEDDIPLVREIERQSFPTVWRAEAYTNELRNPSGCYLVGRWEGRVIGFIGMWLIREEAHIATLAVDPPFRRRGLGRQLLIALIREAVRRGATRMTLEVREGNQAARRLYEGFGFEVIARIGRYYADTGEDAVVMWVHGIHKRSYMAKLAQMGRNTTSTP